MRALSTSVNFSTKEDPRNFSKAPGVITVIEKSHGKMRIWNFIAATKESFPELEMAHVVSPGLGKLAKIVLAPHLVI